MKSIESIEMRQRGGVRSATLQTAGYVNIVRVSVVDGYDDVRLAVDRGRAGVSLAGPTLADAEAALRSWSRPAWDVYVQVLAAHGYEPASYGAQEAA